MKIACIGSRQISLKLAHKLSLIGIDIAEKGDIVVSGNATGSDYAYAFGANMVNPELVHLYLPWKTYNKDQIVEGNQIFTHCEPEWEEMAQKHHPIYDKLTQGAKKMMDRNAGIVMNSDVVLAVLNHQATGFGGTGHGWRVAGELKKYRIDLSVLEGDRTVEEVLDWLKKVKEKLENPLTNV